MTHHQLDYIGAKSSLLAAHAGRNRGCYRRNTHVVVTVAKELTDDTPGFPLSRHICPHAARPSMCLVPHEAPTPLTYLTPLNREGSLAVDATALPSIQSTAHRHTSLYDTHKSGDNSRDDEQRQYKGEIMQRVTAVVVTTRIYTGIEDSLIPVGCRWRWTILVAVLMTLCFASSGQGAPGDLDPTFGVGGKVATDFGGSDHSNALILQPDG